ncbi:MAG: FHA domain-containing protein [Sedimentisphaerales bacterium]|nr:FHA domain-containing protein [Sedimentisphaerales bacterium]
MHVNLVLFKKDGTQKPFPLSSNITVIGRRHDCDLCIPLTLVSRRHCKLSKTDQAVKIRDLDSQNGTFLNGKRIKEAPVSAGDYISIGSLTFLLQVNGEPEKIAPPKQVKSTSAPQAATKEPVKEPVKVQKNPADAPSGSFPELDLSDSFMDELEEL